MSEKLKPEYTRRKVPEARYQLNSNTRRHWYIPLWYKTLLETPTNQTRAVEDLHGPWPLLISQSLKLALGKK